MGIGVRDVQAAAKWYRKIFGMNVEVFEEKATAELMLPHTAGKPIPRHAILALNMQGGGGFEIWQQTKYEAKSPTFEVKLGDLGYFVCKMKCRDVRAFHAFCINNEVSVSGELKKDPAGHETFFLTDPWGNIFQAVASDNWYKKEDGLTGGVYGSIIGVSNMEKSLVIYRDLLEHGLVVYDKEGVFDDLSGLPGGSEKVRRVLLQNKSPRKGPFAKLLGSSQIELVQSLDRPGRNIFDGRIWGDLGFIHLCFDTRGMDLLKSETASLGHPFTVDSAESFDMGVAAGRFSYIEDPDGTLLEFVETLKVPIVAGIGWYMNLKNRPAEKHLPDWMVGTLAWKKKKD